MFGKHLPPLTTGNVIKSNKIKSPRLKLLHGNSGQEGRSGRGGSRRDAAATAKALRLKLNLSLRTSLNPRTAESSHGIFGWGATATAKLKCLDRGENTTTAVSLRDPSEI